MFLDRLVALVNKRSRLVIQSPWIGGIGNCAEEMYFGLLRARDQGKKVLFVFPYDIPGVYYFSKDRNGVNRELFKVESIYRLGSNCGRLLSVIGGGLLTLVYPLLTLFLRAASRLGGKKLGRDYLVPSLGRSGLWNRDESPAFSGRKVRSYRWKEQVTTWLPVELPPRMCAEGERIKRKMGMPARGWFVCLHVRETGFYRSEKKGKTIRNASIQNYLEAIKLITDAGGWVVRMGDETMTPLPQMERVIDYSHTRFKSHLMDIYLIKECRFYIGSQSGILDVASLFQKPMLTPNMSEWLFYSPFRNGDLGIIKHIYSHSEGRFLSLKECPYVFLSSKESFFRYYGDGLEYYENTPKEICDLVKEYLEDGGRGCTCPLQEEWDGIRKAVANDVLQSKMFSKDPMENVNEKYHLAAYLEGCKGRLGGRFLEGNWERSSMDLT